MPHALVAARLSAEHGIGVRHGCFCAHPYLMRLLGLTSREIAAYRRAVRAGDRRHMPGAVRASAGINTTADDIDRFLGAVAAIADGEPSRWPIGRTPTGDYWPEGTRPDFQRATTERRTGGADPSMRRRLAGVAASHDPQQDS